VRRLAIGLHSAALAIAICGCVATTVAARDVNLRSDSDRVVTQPAKAQLRDGSIVIFRDGFRNEVGQLRGTGWRYDPTLRDSVAVSAIPVDSVAGVVAFRTGYDPAQSLGMTAAASVSLVFVLGIAFVAACYATSCLR
jgi:hypothetical protein